MSGLVESSIPCEAARASALERCGAPLRVTAQPCRSQSSALVLSVVGKRARAFLKLHREPRRFAQEFEFYERFAPALGGETPSLLAASAEGRWLLLSACGGSPASQLEPGSPRGPWAFEAAGRFARRLHDLPFVDLDPVPVGVALLRRVRALAAEAAGTALGAHVTSLEAELQALDLDRLVRRPCHRDFTPDNWLLDDGSTGRLFVLDFEHSRPDLPLCDLARLELLHLREAPALREAFWSGYGGASGDEQSALHAAVLRLEAVRTALWAERHRDASFAEDARRMWRALG